MTQPPLPKRKRIRLDRDVYAQPGLIWHATLTTAQRQPAFRNPASAQFAVQTLVDRCEKAEAALLLYCVMPEHIHAVVQIGHDDLIAIVRAVKSILGIWRNKQAGTKVELWQRSFYDRGVRSERDLDDVIGYVLGNPVNEGLVSEWSDYPWIGGTLLERET